MNWLVRHSIESYIRQNHGRQFLDSAHSAMEADCHFSSFSARDGIALISKAAHLLGKPETEIFGDFGEWIARIEPVRNALRVMGRDFSEFLTNLGMLPDCVSLVLSEAAIPQLRVHGAGGKAVSVELPPGRDGWSDLLAGMLRVMAKDYGADAGIVAGENHVEIRSDDARPAISAMGCNDGNSEGENAMKDELKTALFTISDDAISILLPMHLIVDGQGNLLGAGPTSRKFLPAHASNLDEVFTVIHPVCAGLAVGVLDDAVRRGLRLELRLNASAQITLYAHPVRIGADRFLLDLSFGAGLPDAIKKLQLDISDFPASSLASELVFLHDANLAVMRNLPRLEQDCHRAQQNADNRAMMDPLTGLLNFQGFEKAFPGMPGSDLKKEYGFALALLELEYLDEMVEFFGHAAGQRIIARVGRIIGDAMAKGDIAARLEWNRIALILPNIHDGMQARALCERIASAIAKPVPCGESYCHVAANWGIVMSSVSPGRNLEAMLSDAEAALDGSRRSGGGQVTILNLSENPYLRPHGGTIWQ